MTDSGIEVLTEACNGLRALTLRRCKKLTNRAVFAIMRNCRGIQRVDMTECALVAKESIAEAKALKPSVAMLF